MFGDLNETKLYEGVCYLGNTLVELIRTGVSLKHIDRKVIAVDIEVFEFLLCLAIVSTVHVIG